jgi:methionyl-tRNA formyltransferase
MGTPDFAVPCLEAINNSKHEILAVVTQPDRPKGRGKKVSPPPED